MVGGISGIGRHDTVGSVLARSRGIGPGFDLLRILLALYIFYGHTLWIAGTLSHGVAIAGPANAPASAIGVAGSGGFEGWTRPIHVAAVPVFFALSGFLVSGSAFRLRRTTTFLAFRFLRIFPALVAELTLCAVLLGPVLTSLNVASYFRDPVFWRYAGNLIGWVTFDLPGLFLNNPVRAIVNVNLWTLPAEFDCYLVTAALMLTGVLYHRTLFTITMALATAGFAVANMGYGYAVTPGILPPVAITYYFFVGVLFFHWQDQIRAHWALFLSSAVIAYMLLMVQNMVFVAPIFVTYCTVFVGLLAVPRIPLISSGDYSYGIYLYGFPIAQALVAIAPGTFVGHRYLLLLAAVAVTCAFAALSWHVVEKRTLLLKRFLPPHLFPRPEKALAPAPSLEGTVAAGSA